MLREANRSGMEVNGGPAAEAGEQAGEPPAMAAEPIEAETGGALELIVHEAGPEAVKDDSDSDDEDRRRRRAERFGTGYVAPTERANVGIPKGLGEALGGKERRGRQPPPAHVPTIAQIDIFTQEEQDKAKKRAERFGIEVPKNLVNYEPIKPPEDEELRKKRAERFGMEYEPVDITGLKKADLLEPKKDVDATVERRPDAIHVYGVDVLSTSDIKSYFSDFEPRFVEWINDSSCNVLFHDVPSAKKAVVTMGKPLPPSEAPDSYGIDLDQIPFLWHRGVEDFVKDGVPVPLLFRIATVLDKKHITAEHKTRELWKHSAAHDEIDAVLGGGKRRRGGKRNRRGQEGGNGMDVDGEGLPEGITDLRQLIQQKRKKMAGGGLMRMDTEEVEAGGAAGGAPAREMVTYDEL